MSTISLRLPDRLTKNLNTLAASTERSRSYLIRKAVETYVAEYADYQLAQERLYDRTDAVISGRELRKRLGL